LAYREIWGLQLCTEDLQSIKLWPKVYWLGGGWIKAPKYLQLRHHYPIHLDMICRSRLLVRLEFSTKFAFGHDLKVMILEVNLTCFVEFSWESMLTSILASYVHML
jgi:hypothetical protein